MTCMKELFLQILVTSGVLRDNGFNDQFKFNKFLSQVGVGSGFGIRLNIAYIKLRFDFAL
jgi:hypothetical protein